MKLTARKTMVALGTAATVTLSGLSAPAMAADAKADATVTANMDAKTSKTKPAAEKTGDAQKKDEKGEVKCTSDEGDALYSQKYHSVEIDKAAAVKKYNDLVAVKNNVVASMLDRDGQAALDEAELALNNAQFRLNKVELPQKKCGKSTSPEYGELKNAADQITDAERDLNTAASKLRVAKPVVCEESDSKGKDDSGSAGSFDFGSIMQSFGSSGGENKDSGSAGQVKVTKDGKAKCVSRVDFFSDKLKSIVAILTVVFTVITTVTKINETIQKQVMPK